MSERKPFPKQPLTDEEVWLRVYVALAQCATANGDQAIEWADKAVALFRNRFPKRP
jgi:hypothetical protein